MFEHVAVKKIEELVARAKELGCLRGTDWFDQQWDDGTRSRICEIELHSVEAGEVAEDDRIGYWPTKAQLKPLREVEESIKKFVDSNAACQWDSETTIEDNFVDESQFTQIDPCGGDPIYEYCFSIDLND